MIDIQQQQPYSYNKITARTMTATKRMKSSSAAASAYDHHHHHQNQQHNNHDEQQQHHETDRDIDRFTQCSMAQFLPQAQQQQQGWMEHHLSSLGRHTTNHWDTTSDTYRQSDTFPYLTPASSHLMIDTTTTTNTATATATNNSIATENDDEIVEECIDHRLNSSKPTTAKPLEQQQQQQQLLQYKSMPLTELLAQFKPENPPNLEDYTTREAGLEAIQCWLECDSLEESVAKYQRVIDDARNRHDFNSLSFVERQIAKWFVPLQEAIEAKRLAYITKDRTEKDRSFHQFGPLLCALPSAKLAIITAHEAIIQCATRSSHNEERHYSASGARFARLAMTIGQSVEDELVVHKLLHKRSMEEAQSKANNMPDNFKDNVSAMMNVNDVKEEAAVTSLIMDASNDTTTTTTITGTGTDRNSKDAQSATRKWSYTTNHLKEFLDEVSKYKPNEKKRRVISSAVQKARNAAEKADSWTIMDKAQLGSALLQILVETVTIGSCTNGDDEMAFSLELRWVNSTRSQSYLTMNDQLLKMIAVDDIESLSATATRHRPMIVPPKPWTAAKKGGYLVLEVDVMRYHGCTTQKEAIMNAESSTVFDGLNALSRVKWVINQEILDVAQRCWDDNIPLGDIPSRTDYELPDQPIAPQWTGVKLEKGTDGYDAAVSELMKYRDQLVKYNRVKQKNADLVSLRCSTMLKLNQADKFKDFDAIYFPYNIDFRGRAYPVPPHFSNVGSDLCRGMLLFADAKPLGDRGLFWLKVHLANLAGKDKMTFDGREKFVDDQLHRVRESAADPFGGERWWMTLENPFQALAACREIVNAIDSGDPASYMCTLAVHMDGSCNGLQHYAALGRDLNGGKAVNLCVTNEPQDVYVGVMHEVIRRVSEEAKRTFDYDMKNLESLTAKQRQELKLNRAAKLVDGLIDRGVVKRTVMTSVYGVTYVGARTQIQEKIEQKLSGKGYDLDEIDSEVFSACSYLAFVTLEVIGDLFSGAKSTMNWLTSCARLITQHGYPVAWISPMGLPAVQPYRQKKTAKVVTLAQTVSLNVINDDLPIHKARQCSAFPPNFIHSLDSSHMLFTALEMDRRGLTFSAVHDSFWTHPCDVDEMNCALRDTFVDLYSQPLLERLKETWELRYPELIFPDLPARGELALDDVRNATYFFQ
jgi:DNA-directed RNA polymerase, mitochondrial